MSNKNKGMRHFFVCCISENGNGSFNVTNIRIETDGDYPTIKKCIDTAKEAFPDRRNVALVSISEMSPEDWKVFISEQ